MIVEINNFQKIKYAKLELNGYCTITGESARGKSCTVRAIRAALLGKSHENNISHGSSSSSVLIDFTKDKVLWERVPSTQVTVNETQYTRVSKNYQELVTEPLGILNIDVGSKEITPQIATQLRPFFLVLETPSVVAKAFQVISEVDRINEAVVKAKKDLRDLSAELKVRKKDKLKAGEKLKAYESVTEIDIVKLQNDLVDIESKKELTKSISVKIKRLKSLMTLPGCFIPEEISPNIEINIYLDKIKKINRLRLLNPLPGSVKVVDSSGVLPNTSSINKLNELKTLRERIEKGKGVIANNENNCKKCDTALSKVKELLKICPTCGKEF